MFSFRRIAVAMVSLHRKRNPRQRAWMHQQGPLVRNTGALRIAREETGHIKGEKPIHPFCFGGVSVPWCSVLDQTVQRHESPQDSDLP